MFILPKQRYHKNYYFNISKKKSGIILCNFFNGTGLQQYVERLLSAEIAFYCWDTQALIKDRIIAYTLSKSMLSQL